MNYNSFVYDQQLKTNAPMQMAYAIVEFRPLDSYDGDFGFDWFRVGDCGDKAFKDIIISPLSQLENEYKKFNVPDSENQEKFIPYYIPYLSLYSDKVSATVKEGEKPPYKAELRMSLRILSELEKIEFDYDEKYFSIKLDGKEQKVLPEKSLVPCEKHFLSYTIQITCRIKEEATAATGKGQTKKTTDTAEDGFRENKEIKVWAYPTGDKDGKYRKLAGKIILPMNDSFHRGRKNVVFVKVKTDIEDTKTYPKSNNGVQDKEISRLKKALYQSLTYTATEKYSEILDLTDNNDFKIIRKEGKEVFGKFIYQKGITKVPSGMDKNKTTDKQLFQDHPKFFSTLRQLFLDLPKNTKYKNYIIAFYFEESTYDTFVLPSREWGLVPGQIEEIGKKTLAVFAKHYDDTLAHETLHACGLYHPFDKQSKHQFQKHMTDNIMDYRKDESEPFKTFTWAWQWKIVNQKLRI